MISKKKTLFITIIFLLCITALRVVWMIAQWPPDHPSAMRGEIDLRQWHFAAEKAVTLNGEWEFYPYILSPEVAAPSSTQPSSYAKLPGLWEASVGTYRLKIFVAGDGEQAYGWHLPVIPAATTIYVNGDLVASSDEQRALESERAETIKTSQTPSTIYYATTADELELIIQYASQQDNVKAGILRSIKFGSEQAIRSETAFNMNMQLLVCAILLMHAIYLVVLLLMNHRQKGLLYFFMLTLSVMVMTLVDDDRLLFQWLDLSDAWAYKIQVLAYIAGAATMLLFARHLLADPFAQRLSQGYFVICSLFVVFVLLSPINYVHLFPHQLLMFFPVIIAIILIIRAVWARKEGAIFLLLGSVTIIINIVWGNVNQHHIVEMNYYPLDLIICFIVFASYWFNHYYRTAEQARQLAIQLQKEDKRKDEFLTNTSHELRNPLHGIINIAQAIQENEQHNLSARSKEQLDTLLVIGRHMSYMLNDLLDATRLKERALKLQLASVSLPTTAAGVIDIIRPMVQGKALRFVNRIPADFPPVLADETRLIQILFNLLHNAVKYTLDGTITITAKVQGKLATIRVEDTGMGIDEAMQQRLFEPYVQSDSSMTAVGSGIGLGLSICQQLVSLHGGTIAVRSKLGQGSVFTFTLQLATEAPLLPFDGKEHDVAETDYKTGFAGDTVASVVAASAAHSAVAHANIMLVDDDPLNLDVLATILSHDDYEFVTATSGEEALSLLDEREWDLIIADVMMPHMSGYELCRTIRERFTSAELPLLLLTARSQPEDIEAGFLAGANDYVTKPMEAMELRSRVRALTGLKQSVREKLRMEAAWLQAQIQPHFLFNTLNTIAALSDIDSEKMLDLLEQFGHYLQSSFDFKNSERLVPLEHELALVRSYLYIEQVRFEERLQVKWEVGVPLDVHVPPLSIQPLVENAIRHGILKRPEGGQIVIRISDHGQHAKICISDDGVGMDEETLCSIMSAQADSHSGVGIINTDRRLRQLYRQGLIIDSQPNKGTRVCFQVKK